MMMVMMMMIIIIINKGCQTEHAVRSITYVTPHTVPRLIMGGAVPSLPLGLHTVKGKNFQHTIPNQQMHPCYLYFDTIDYNNCGLVQHVSTPSWNHHQGLLVRVQSRKQTIYVHVKIIKV